MTFWPSYLNTPPMPEGALPLELRIALGGLDRATHLWESVWLEGVYRGSIAATVVCLVIAVAVFSLSVLLKGRSS